MPRRPYEIVKDLDKFEISELIDLLNRTVETITWTSPILNSRLGEVEPPSVFQRAGMLAYATGIGWDPGSGEGIYYMNAAGVWTGIDVSGASLAFKTFVSPAGTDVVAEIVADTLTFASGHSALTITGDETSDTITFNIVPGNLPAPSVDDIYVNETGDTMTGLLILDPTSGTNALESKQDILLTAGKKLIFDAELVTAGDTWIKYNTSDTSLDFSVDDNITLSLNAPDAILKIDGGSSIGNIPGLLVTGIDDENYYRLEIRGKTGAAPATAYPTICTGVDDSRIALMAGTYDEYGPRIAFIGKGDTGNPNTIGWAVLDYGSDSTTIATAEFRLRWIKGTSDTAVVDMMRALKDTYVVFPGRTDANLLYVDSYNNKVGVGTDSPASKLHVVGSGVGGVTDYDISIGDVTTPEYGIIRIGDSIIGRTSYNVGNMDVDGAFVIRNEGGPVTSQIEFFIAESGGNAIRFALAKSGVGNATYNPRSMIIAGPAVLDDDIVKVSYWQTQGIFHNLVMDTSGGGADLGVQNDLEVEGDIFVDSIKESTTSAGVSFNEFNIVNVGNIALDSISSDAGTSITVTLGTDAGDDFLVGNNNALVVEGDTDRVGIGTSSPQLPLHVIGVGILVATNETDSAVKYASLFGAHYDTSEEDVTLFRAFMGATTNIIQYGGGGSGSNAATNLQFLTAANSTTLLGIERLNINSFGRLIFNPTNTANADFIIHGTTNDAIFKVDVGAEDVRILDNVELKLGTTNRGEIYYDITNLIIDPDAAGTGKVLIGATGDDDMSVSTIYCNDIIVLPKVSGKGIKVDTTTPTFGWRDLIGDQFSKDTGATKPALTAYNGVIFGWLFSAGDEAYLTYHIPHDYVAGTDVHLHIHWSHIGTLVTGGTVTFKATSIYAKGHNQAPFTGTPAVGTFTGTPSTTQYQHIITETQYSASTPAGLQIDTDLLEPDGVVEMTFEVDANNLTVSGGGVPDIFIHYVDIHYQSTNIGTKDKAPDFYA